MKKLTAKQKRFCEEYMKDLNATQAAIRAGYSKKTAGEIGYEHLKKPEIQAYIAKLQAETRERNKIDVDFVVRGIKEIAINGEKEEVRLKAYDLLGKHLGIYERDNRQKLTALVVKVEE